MLEKIKTSAEAEAKSWVSDFGRTLASGDAVALARAVAVLGEGGDLAVLSAMTGLPAAAIETAGRALIRAEILRPEPPLGFVHPLIRDAVYHELSSLEREARHAQAAQLLRAAGRPAESVAAHASVLPPSGHTSERF